MLFFLDSYLPQRWHKLVNFLQSSCIQRLQIRHRSQSTVFFVSLYSSPQSSAQHSSCSSPSSSSCSSGSVYDSNDVSDTIPFFVLKFLVFESLFLFLLPEDCNSFFVFFLFSSDLFLKTLTLCSVFRILAKFLAFLRTFSIWDTTCTGEICSSIFPGVKSLLVKFEKLPSPVLEQPGRGEGVFFCYTFSVAVDKYIHMYN